MEKFLSGKLKYSFKIVQMNRTLPQNKTNSGGHIYGIYYSQGGYWS